MGMTVKQVAESVGLPSRTIRYYDRIGLVAAEDRTAAGYRLYSSEDEGKLRFIRKAKALGFSLEDIRGLMEAAERGCDKIAELSAFRERLVSYAAGKGSGCGCQTEGAFCGCLDDVSQMAVSG
jgi:DNA-binding transcriptional MerR regulator